MNQIDNEKLKTLHELESIVRDSQKQGKKVVWTNGCYDILHAGHVLYLESAKAQGDALIVGLNSDISVQKTKGPKRPIVQQHYRAKLLAALECVDYVILFDDESPLAIIDHLKPDIYAKGGDYNINTIHQQERQLVERYGGKIALLPGVQGLSTSKLIEKILDAYTD